MQKTGILFVICFCAVAQGAAGQTYHGSLTAKGHHINVTLSLSQTEQNLLRFGEPFACSMKLEASGQEDSQSFYNFSGAGAGACRNFNFGHVVLHSAKNGNLLEIFNRENEKLYGVDMH